MNWQEIAKRLKSLLLGLMNFAFAVAGFICLGFGVWGLWSNADLPRVATGLASGLVFLFAASIERFESLKGLGVEAKTRKLDAAIDQANATLEQLRALATSFSQVALTELMSGHFAYGSTSLTTRIELHDKLLSTLKGLGVSGGQIDMADENWRKGIAAIYHSKITDLVSLRKERQPGVVKVPEERRLAGEELKAMFKSEEFQAPSPEVIEGFISSRGMMTSEIQEWISDYQHYIRHDSIRRLSEFVAL